MTPLLFHLKSEHSHPKGVTGTGGNGPGGKGGKGGNKEREEEDEDWDIDPMDREKRMRMEHRREIMMQRDRWNTEQGLNENEEGDEVTRIED